MLNKIIVWRVAYMFQGTQNKKISNRTIGIEVHKYTEITEISKDLFEDCFSLILLSKGKVCGKINNRKYTFYSPVVLCFSNKDEVDFIESDSRTEMYVISFDPVVLNQSLALDVIHSTDYTDLCEQHHFIQLKPFMEARPEHKCFVLNQKSTQSYINRILKLEKNLTLQNDTFWHCRARSELLIIMYFIENIVLNYKIKSQDSIMPKDLTDIICYINENLSKQITLKHLYEKFYINANRIESLFNVHFGTTLRQYIRDKRLEKAKECLRFTDLSNKNIAALIGFSTPQNFCKFFRSMTGTSPDAFRKEQLAKKSEDPQLRKTANN